MGKRLIEGYWDCKYCETKKIKGSIKECPNCGKARDENTTFYLSGEHNYVTPKKADTINRNPDWICSYCKSLNSDNDKYCTSCGAPRTVEELNYFENKRKKTEKSNSYVDCEEEPEEKKDYTEETITPSKSTNHFKREKNPFKVLLANTNILKYFLVGLFSLLAITGIIYLCIPKNQDITISQMSWERSIEIERYQTVNESDWQLPSNARLQYTQLEFSHYEQVLDHYETKTRQVERTRISGYEEYVVGTKDLGNGYFEEITDTRPIYETYYETETYEEPVYRDEPVYRTKYYYEIDKWLYERSEKTSAFDKEPYWAEPTLARDERISSKKETYYVDGFDKDEKTYHYYMDYEDWNGLEVGQRVTLNVSVLGYAKLVE